MLAPTIIFTAVYVLIAFNLLDKTAAAMLGAVMVVGLHLVPYKVALASIDLNVLLLLIGMMTIMGILATTGFIEWMAVVIAQRARGNGPVIMVLFLFVTAFTSAFLDNVTTVILIAPITILITQILEVPTAPVLIMEAIFSNIGGTATLIGDPPNIIIGSSTYLTFTDFIFNLTPVVVVIALVCVAIFYRRAGAMMKAAPETRDRILKAVPRLAITDLGRIKRGLPVLGLTILGFFLSRPLDIEPGIIAIGGAMIMIVVCRIDIHTALERIEWNTILFFIGLFMTISALEYNGVFQKAGTGILEITRGNLFLTVIVILWLSAITSAIVDNIPLVIAMLPLIQSIVPTFANPLGLDPASEAATASITEPLLWALALGACLGGNGTLVGASANVVIAQIGHRNRCEITFWDFTKQGLPMMIASVAVATIYLWLRYF